MFCMRLPGHLQTIIWLAEEHRMVRFDIENLGTRLPWQMWNELGSSDRQDRPDTESFGTRPPMADVD